MGVNELFLIGFPEWYPSQSNMKTKRFFALFTFILMWHTGFGAAKLFFFKTYSDDFKKNSTLNFFGGDPIYGLINVSAISVNDNTITSLAEFSDARGAVMIRLYFPDLDKEVSWRMTLASGRVKDNRFLFCVMPESADKLDKDYLEVLKVFNQLKGKKFTMNVRAGEKDVTAWWQEDLTIDLTGGMGAYADWYAQKVPTLERNINTFYTICESNSSIDLENELSVRYLTSDSIGFSSKDKFYSLKKTSGFNFVKNYFFHANKIDDNSFVLYQASNEAWRYLNADKNKANETDRERRCPTEPLVKLIEETRLYDKKQLETDKTTEEAAKAKDKARAPVVLNNYAMSFKSKRVDPVLEKGIIKWWNGDGSTVNPGIKIYFIQPEFKIVRNDLGVVLRKTLEGFILSAKDGKCYVQWQLFGYESLGGGVFDQAVTVWANANDAYYTIEGIEFKAISRYEINCSSLKK